MNLPNGCVDLTARARGKDYSFIGRDEETEQIIECLLRIKKPNVILVGEPGVGKTALVKRLAWLIANEVVHPALKNYRVIEISPNGLLAGDGYRGVFEKKVEDVINMVRGEKVILFIDELHTAVSLGCMANGQTPGFGNAFKPILTDGTVRVIGATTTDEAKTITDKAFLRRFTKIVVNEPEKRVVIEIIKTCFKNYNKTSIEISVPNIEDQVYQLSLNLEGFNPDKADELVDSLIAAARVREVSIDEAFLNKFTNRALKSRGIQIDNSVNIDQEEKEIML